mmetsp:Transcript_85088/g.150466  ORF Transcript_85088/g.150466 Transcript_85088/m.150466 type:complete len:273 (-) Transcript_85088:128-946(-)
MGKKDADDDDSAFSDVSEEAPPEGGNSAFATPRKHGSMAAVPDLEKANQNMKEEIEKRNQEHRDRMKAELLRPIQKKPAPPSDGSGFSDVSEDEKDEGGAKAEVVTAEKPSAALDTDNPSKEREAVSKSEQQGFPEDEKNEREARDTTSTEASIAGQPSSNAENNSVGRPREAAAKERLAKFEKRLELMHHPSKGFDPTKPPERRETWHAELVGLFRPTSETNTRKKGRRQTWHGKVVKSKSQESILSPVGSGLSAARLLQPQAGFTDVLPG